MTKAELIDIVADKVEGVTKAQTAAVYDAIFETIARAVKEDDKKAYTVKDFGTFKLKERAERKGINLQTKEPITIPASVSVGFTASKGLKEAVAKK
jgi:nucleoid DNA-binding protein